MSVRKRTWKSGAAERTAWIVDYRDQQGARRLQTFATKKEADAWAVGALHEVKQGVHTPTSVSKTVIEATELWIARCEGEGLEFGTVKQRREHLKLHIGPFIGREKLSTLTKPRIHQFDAELRAAGRSLSMRRKVLTNLKTTLTFAQSRGLVSQNVARDVRIKSDDRRAATKLREGHDFPSRSELRALMDEAPPRWRPFVITAVFTGMRASELRGLRWRDVDLEAGVIHVRQRADAWGKIGNPKSKAGTRDIPLTPMAVNALNQWQVICPTGELGLVFPNGRGNVDSHQNILNRFWLPLQMRIGMTVDTGGGTSSAKYGLHVLRHTAASLFIAHLGWTPKRLQEVMGHASITMTFDLYGHLFEDREGDREAMKKLEAAFVAA